MSASPVIPLRDRVRRRLAMASLLAVLFATPLAVFVFGSDGPATPAGSALAPVEVDVSRRGALAGGDPAAAPVSASEIDPRHARVPGRTDAAGHNGVGAPGASNGNGAGQNGSHGNGSNGDFGGFLVSSAPLGLPLWPEITPDAIDPPLAVNLFADGHGPRADRGAPWAIASGPVNAPRRTGGGSGGPGGSGGSGGSGGLGGSGDPGGSRGSDGHGNTDTPEETGRDDPRFEGATPAVAVPAPAPLWLMLGLLGLAAWLRRVRPSACGAPAR